MFKRQKHQAKASTINRQLAVLLAYGLWAKSSGSIPYNPVDGIKSIDQQKHAPKWLDRREQAALLREAERRIQAAKTEPAKRQAIRDHCILIVLLNTGLRVSELVNLEMIDISLMDRKGEFRPYFCANRRHFYSLVQIQAVSNRF